MLTIQDAMAAVKAQPGNPFNWLDLGNALAASGDKAKAKECYEKALSLDPDFDDARAALRAIGETPPTTPPPPLPVAQPSRSGFPILRVFLFLIGLGTIIFVGLAGAAVIWASSSTDAILSDNFWLQQLGITACKMRAGEYVESTDDILERWADTYRLGASTSRITLSPVVQRMQDLRSEAAKQGMPGCLRELNDILLDSMDSTIDGYLAFMGDADEDKVTEHFTDSGKDLGRFLRVYDHFSPGARERVLDDMGVDP